MEINKWIKACRAAAGMNQTELGEQLSVGKANVSAWENGRHEPSYSQMLKIGGLAKWIHGLPGAPNGGPWPFTGISPAEYDSLPQAEKDEVLTLVRMKVSRFSKPDAEKAA